MLAFLLLAFGFRLWFGLSLGLSGEDPRQIYLTVSSVISRGLDPTLGPTSIRTFRFPGPFRAL
jgi:hypothetical protein